MKRECHCLRAEHKHGTVRAYQRDGCRCLPCRLAKHRSLAAYRAGGSWNECAGALVPLIGVQRRLRALMWLGYSSSDIANRSGISESHIQNLRNRSRSPRISVDIAKRVCDVYDHLWDVRAVGPSANRQRTKARTMNYLPPLAWDDDTIDDPAAVPYTPPTRIDYTHPDLPKIATRRHQAPPVDDIAVELAMRGDKVRLTHAERVEAVRLLHERGLNPTEIARRLRMSGASVATHLDERDAAA